MMGCDYLSWFSLPIAPPWEGMHVLAVHVPIALLLIAPAFVFVAMIFPLWARWASWAALLLLIAGTAGTFVAVTTGEAAQAAAHRSGEVAEVMTQHAKLAELTRNVFVVLTAVYALFLLLPVVFIEVRIRGYLVPVNFVFLVALAGASLLLVNTGHLGIRLVHEFGVTATISQVADPGECPNVKPPAKPGGKEPAPKEKPATPPVLEKKPVDKVAKPEEKPVKPQEKEAKAQEKPAKAEEKAAKPEEKPAKPQDKEAKPQEKPVKAEEKGAKPEEKPAKPQEKDAKAGPVKG